MQGRYVNARRKPSYFRAAVPALRKALHGASVTSVKDSGVTLMRLETYHQRANLSDQG
jgi:hypothetical protein